MKWPVSARASNPYGGEAARSLQVGAAVNRSKKVRNGSLWMRLVWLVWALALALLLRSAWLGLHLESASSITPGHKEKENNLIVPTKKKDNSVLVPSKAEPQLAVSAKASSPEPVATVAHAVSFLSCGAALTSKYKDAMLVLRHSIHQNSILAQNSTSRYSYKMYAFVNDDPSKKCQKYTSWIERMGYTPLLLPNPVNISTIENEHFRTQIDKTGVAGSSELIKLYLYTLTNHPIVVHWDIDVIVLVRTG
jgi:hypothetical protein